LNDQCHGCGTSIPRPRTGRRKWCSEKCRRQTLYAGTCLSCGGPTDGSNGRGKAPLECRACAPWSAAQIIAAVQRWAKHHDGRPPTADAWKKSTRGDFLADYPISTTVQRVFGSWANGIEAAGFPRPHQGRDPYADPRLTERIVALYRSGSTGREVASAVGVGLATVYTHLRRANEPRRPRFSRPA
jgi:hypothetical protein